MQLTYIVHSANGGLQAHCTILPILGVRNRAIQGTKCIRARYPVERQCARRRRITATVFPRIFFTVAPIVKRVPVTISVPVSASSETSALSAWPVGGSVPEALTALDT